MSSTIDRATFVGAGAAALTVAGGSAADAQTPHPPMVAENDPAIVVMTPSLKRPDATINAYAAMPRTITATTPGIVMTMAIWGIDTQLRDVLRRYAKAGFIAIAPNLYARDPSPSGDGNSDVTQFQPAAAALAKGGHAVGDLLAAHDWIRSQAPRSKVGITGFCMGGGIALASLIGTQDYAAAAIFYGNVRQGVDRKAPVDAHTFDWTQKVTTPVLGSYGADDTGILAPDVAAAYARFTQPHDVKIYDGAPHAFFDDTRASYRPAQAADAWARTTAWFGKYLNGA